MIVILGAIENINWFYKLILNTFAYGIFREF